jgi:uncharacterized protein
LAGSSKGLSSFSNYLARLVDHRWLCLLTLIVCTLLSIGGFQYPSWPKDLVDYFWNEKSEATNSDAEPTKNRRGRRASNVARESVGGADAYLIVRCDDFFTPQASDAARAVVKTLRELPQVADVQWIEDAPPLNIFGLPEPLLPKSNSSVARFEASKKKATEHPFVIGNYLSKDGRTMLVHVYMNWIHVWNDDDCTTKIVEAANQAIAAFPNITMQFDITGEIPIRLQMIKNSGENQLKYQLIGYGIILVMAAILFRGFWVVIVVALAPVIGVFWTLGWMNYFGLQDNPFSDVILPVLLSLVGFTDGVHMMVFIRRRLAEGLTPREACRKTIQAVGLACMLTSLTTAIGMGSLILARHEIVREFGWACVMGVSATWISVMVFIPFMCLTGFGRRLAHGSERNNFIDHHLDKVGIIVSWALRHHRTLSIVAIILLITTGFVAMRLQPDDRTSTILPEGSKAQATLAHLDDALGGLNICWIDLNWVPNEKSAKQVAEVIAGIDKTIDQDPLLAHPISLCRLIEALPGEGSAVDRVSMVEILPPPLKLAFYDPEAGEAKITFRVKDLGTSIYKESFEKIEAKLDEVHKATGFVCQLNGDRVRSWRDLYRIVVDLVTSLGTASIVIFVVMMIAFRSIRIGLISIVPNMLPLGLAASWMTITGQPLEIVSVCAFTVCIGIAVDDTIHFLSRYAEELVDEPNQIRAIEKSFSAVGTGMIMTTIVLVAGFSSVLTSETREHRIFASLGVLTLATALICDIVLLPPLLAMFDRKQIKGKNESET